MGFYQVMLSVCPLPYDWLATVPVATVATSRQLWVTADDLGDAGGRKS